MKTQYHQEITRQALGQEFSQAALETVVIANIGQDALRYQIGHDHYHYDNNSFSAGDAYCEKLRQEVKTALARGDAPGARAALGRLTHTVQDFYAHSNYVGLWRESHPDASPELIDPRLPELLQDPRLCSGRIYYPLEVFSFIPALKPYVLPLLPRDSHAWMNQDDPGCKDFVPAFAAALQRTRLEFHEISQSLAPAALALLTGREV